MNLELQLNRSELCEALRLLKRTVAERSGEEAVLSFDGQSMHIDYGGGCVQVSAAGTMDCQARVMGAPLTKLADTMPDQDPIVLKVERGRLFLGTIGLSCKLQDAWSKTINLPVNMTAQEAARLLVQYTEEEIEKSGLLKIFRIFEHDLNKAAAALKPYGITREELKVLVIRKNHSLRETLE